MHKPIRILAAAALACAAFPVAAQPSAEQLEKVRNILTEADANGDGRVTRREYDAHRDDIFAKLDRNGNGVASEEDAPKIRIARKKFTEKLEQVLAMADKNGDGLLSRAEWDKPERDIFALIDQDEDGVIILADLPVL
ncbi:EF-hand domain-containing protein [Erythrobacter donghaensis]|jgi:Ca2+-binding EF-hand superfamily protein|uniref:EF-hand domain-containing protein n=1 Tax=Erythrobacter donghaensis TaxID=267135 RepID=UPI00093B2B8E|nr:EF-hand domain-containing protein [Erythrobacter donghaensis]